MGKDARVQKKVAEVRRYLVKAKELVEVEGRVRINSGSWKIE